MREKFIERGTDFELRNGKLILFESNTPSKDIQFYFDRFNMNIMLAGQKSVVSDNLKIEFFPGTFFIPEKGVINSVSIANASFNNPTKCLALDLNPSFVQEVYEELLYSENDKKILHDEEEDDQLPYFLSNDQFLIEAFTKLYILQVEDKVAGKELIEDLILREILYRLFSTPALSLLRSDFSQSIVDHNIRKVISYVQDNIGNKITASKLAQIAGLGNTTFFKVFKDSTGYSPIEYILKERIRQAKIMITKNRSSMQEIAFMCGFNSYEYFCSSFRKIEGQRPTEFKKLKKTKVSA